MLSADFQDVYRIALFCIWQVFLPFSDGGDRGHWEMLLYGTTNGTFSVFGFAIW